jgi:hypothetical protein
MSAVGREHQDSAAERLVLTAPLSGYLAPIEAVPDPVFAQKMVGDGISLGLRVSAHVLRATLGRGRSKQAG